MQLGWGIEIGPVLVQKQSMNEADDRKDEPGNSKTSLRVLFLATYFPRPLNMLLGPWALAQCSASAADPRFSRCIAHAVGSQGPCSYARREGVCIYASQAQLWRSRGCLSPLASVSDSAIQTMGISGAAAAVEDWLVERRQALRRGIRRSRPDVIFAHHTAVNGYVALRLQQQFNIPYVVMDHDFQEISYCEQFPAQDALRGRLSSRISRRCLLQPDGTGHAATFSGPTGMHDFLRN